MLISPSRRLFEGPGGHAHLPPLIMQVFLVLLDAGGKVVTRNQLFDECWGGAIVGDESLNQAITKLRRTGTEVAPGLFELETIPRTGYRLTGEILGFLNTEAGSAPSGEAARRPVSRRRLIGSAATVAALGAGGLWWVTNNRTDPRFTALMERGQDALRMDEPGAAKFFEQAVAIEPNSARAWGLLAYALADAGDQLPREATGRTAQSAERAARTALEIDPKQPDALLTMTIVQRGMLDWFSREETFRQILSLDPDNVRVIRSLGMFLHSVGRCRDSLAMTNRALAIEPFAPDPQLRKALRLWVLGRVADADRVSNRAMELWPSHRLVRMARLMIYAFTGRARAALAMVEEEEAKPTFLPQPAASVWRSLLIALETPTAPAIAAARKAGVEGSKASPGVAAWTILALSALGELDAAFEVANGYLLDRGSVIVRPRPEAKAPYVNNSGWRNTNGLFTPPTKAMRLDPRFGPLAEGLGLTDYWRRRGVGPDAFLFTA